MAYYSIIRETGTMLMLQCRPRHFSKKSLPHTSLHLPHSPYTLSHTSPNNSPHLSSPPPTPQHTSPHLPAQLHLSPHFISLPPHLILLSQLTSTSRLYFDFKLGQTNHFKIDNPFTASLLDARHQRDSVKNKAASLLAVLLGKALGGISPLPILDNVFTCNFSHFGVVPVPQTLNNSSLVALYMNGKLKLASSFG